MIGLFLCASLLCASPDHAITHEAGGRFGDHLLSYLHAKWISYQYQIPYRYTPFPHSSRLALHTKEQRLKTDPNHGKRLTMTLMKGVVDLQRTDPVLYVCPYFPENQMERNNGFDNCFDVDWKNPKFRKIVRQMVAPKKSLKLIVPPSHTINIALHVREGGGYDDASARLLFPLKVPPMSFYIEALQKILLLFPGKEMLCQIFTDARDPAKIAETFRSALPANSLVQFAYRTNNSHDTHVVNDFFSLFNFDILIRSQSNFSLIPALIHDYAIVYAPMNAVVEGDQVIISKTEMEINDPLYQKILLKKRPWWKLFSW